MLFDGEFLIFHSCNLYMKILKLSFIKFRNKIVIKNKTCLFSLFILTTNLSDTFVSFSQNLCVWLVNDYLLMYYTNK